ncbi:MAG: response regulator [Chloroflexi bacterium]|nr:response regulator [Chloroflexota bacterium]
MPSSRIVIVDDQREVARVLRSGLESLEAELSIAEFLSGEEAWLELSRGTADLLVADVRLPGMSGFELAKRFKERAPDAKLILISGATDPKIRKEVAQAGADAFFFKPIEMADFLDSVERVLGMVSTILPHELDLERQQAEMQADDEREAKGMSGRIADLRAELGAQAVLLTGDRGQVLVRAGALPSPDVENVLLPAILPSFAASAKASQLLRKPLPESLLTFGGQDFDIALSHVGDAYALVIIMNELKPSDLPKLMQATQFAVQEVLLNLSALGVAVAAPEAAAAPEPAPEPEELPVDPELEALFAKKTAVKVSDADAFWESSSQSAAAAAMGGSDALSYEQAKQLGLAPPEE